MEFGFMESFKCSCGLPRSSDGCLALANSDLAKLKKFVVMGKSQILIVQKLVARFGEWLIQDKMIRELFSGVYVTTKGKLSQNAKKNLLHICELILLDQALQ